MFVVVFVVLTIVVVFVCVVCVCVLNVLLPTRAYAYTGLVWFTTTTSSPNTFFGEPYVSMYVCITYIHYER